MICPKCNSNKTKVVDSKSSKKLHTWRRRECANCHHRFNTYEVYDVDAPVMRPLLKIKLKSINSTLIAITDEITKTIESLSEKY